MPSVKMNKVRKALSIGSPSPRTGGRKKKRGSSNRSLRSDGGRSVSSASSWASSTADSQWDANSEVSASPSLNQSEGTPHKPLYPRIESKEVEDDVASCHSVSSSSSRYSISSSSSLPPLESRPTSPPPPAGSPAIMPRVPEDKESVALLPPPIWVEDSVWSKRASSSSPVVSIPLGEGPAFAAAELPPPPQSARKRQGQQQQHRRRGREEEEDNLPPPPPPPLPSSPPPEQRPPRPSPPSPTPSVPLRDPFAPRLALAKERKKRAIRDQTARRKSRAESMAAASSSFSSDDGSGEKLRPFVAVMLLVGALLSLSLLTSSSDGQSSASSASVLLLDRLDDRLAIQSASKKYTIATSAKDWDALRTVLTADVTVKYEEESPGRGGKMCVDYFDETHREKSKKRRQDDDQRFLGGLFGEPRYREGSLEGVTFTSPETAISEGTIVRPIVVRGMELPFLGWYASGSYKQEWMKDEREWKSFAWKEDVSHEKLLWSFFARVFAASYLTLGAIALPAKLLFWRKQK